MHAPFSFRFVDLTLFLERKLDIKIDMESKHHHKNDVLSPKNTCGYVEFCGLET